LFITDAAENLIGASPTKDSTEPPSFTYDFSGLQCGRKNKWWRLAAIDVIWRTRRIRIGL
jgi:hypothetical protein